MRNPFSGMWTKLRSRIARNPAEKAASSATAGQNQAKLPPIEPVKAPQKEAPEPSARQKAQSFFRGGLQSTSFAAFCKARSKTPKEVLSVWVTSARYRPFFEAALEEAEMGTAEQRDQYPEDSPQLMELAGRKGVKKIMAAIVKAEKEKAAKAAAQPKKPQ